MDSTLRISHLNIFPINSRVLYFGICWEGRRGNIEPGEFCILAIFTMLNIYSARPEFQRSQVSPKDHKKTTTLKYQKLPELHRTQAIESVTRIISVFRNLATCIWWQIWPLEKLVHFCVFRPFFWSNYLTQIVQSMLKITLGNISSVGIFHTPLL